MSVNTDLLLLTIYFSLSRRSGTFTQNVYLVIPLDKLTQLALYIYLYISGL